MRRQGQGRLLKFTVIGAYITAVFVIMAFFFIAYMGDLSRTTVIKSQAAYDKLGVTEEVLNAGCATRSRGVFEYEAITSGNLSCITSDRAIGISFRVGDDPGVSEFNYTIQNGDVEESSGGIVSGSEGIRRFPMVVNNSGEIDRGEVWMAVSGTGWQCRQLPGRCVDADSVCINREDADCGPNSVCCRITPGPGAP